MIEYKVHKLWSWIHIGGITIGKHIFLHNPQDPMTLEHELVHVQQFAREGVWFWVAYLLLLPVGWNPWRAQWEAEAYQVELRAGVPLGSIVKALSGPLYGWCCRPAQATELLLRQT